MQIRTLLRGQLTEPTRSDREASVYRGWRDSDDADSLAAHFAVKRYRELPLSSLGCRVHRLFCAAMTETSSRAHHHDVPSPTSGAEMCDCGASEPHCTEEVCGTHRHDLLRSLIEYSAEASYAGISNDAIHLTPCSDARLECTCCGRRITDVSDRGDRVVGTQLSGEIVHGLVSYVAEHDTSTIAYQ